jgi:hypothetical protein
LSQKSRAIGEERFVGDIGGDQAEIEVGIGIGGTFAD